MKIWGYGQDEVDMSTRKYQILYKATPIHDLSEVHEGDKLVVREASTLEDYLYNSEYTAEGELEIKSDIRGLHKEE